MNKTVPNIILHIGLPRTGTTVLQKHIIVRSKTCFLITKEAYTSPLIQKNNSVGFQEPKISLGSLAEGIIDEKQYILHEYDANKEVLDIILKVSGCLSAKPIKKRVESLNKLETSFAEFIEILSKRNNTKNILISSERFSMTSASLKGEREHRDDQDQSFPIYPLLKSVAEIKTPLILVCLRDPIEYLTSMYLWTVVHRKLNGMNAQSPIQYITNQIMLEIENPGTSILTTAMHANFLKELGKYGFVKAIGFKELINSTDVFSLLGLSSEVKYSYKNFPLENRLQFPKVEREQVVKQIKIALKNRDFLSRLQRNQLFE